MPETPYYHIDAFADAPFTGNQAAVMPLEAWPDDALLQKIAEENNFAETAYIIPDENGEADYELRWFTPSNEIRLCGHATLASGHYILSANPNIDRVTFATRKAGILSVSRSASSGYDMALPIIKTEPSENLELIELMGRKSLDYRSSSGRYHIFRYGSAEEIHVLSPDLKALAQIGDDQFIATAPGEDSDVISRVFVPGAGVDEDSVTGSAHCALTPYWAEILGRESFTAYQASARGGYVGCRLDGNMAVLSGNCVTVVSGSFNLPD